MQTSRRRGTSPSACGLRPVAILGSPVAAISIIVATRDARQYVERTLCELGATGHELIVVDCASTDGTAAFVHDRFAETRLVELDANPGYGSALNKGVQLSSGDYLLLMNADAWPARGDVDHLVAFAESEPSAGAVGPRLLNPDGSLQRSVRGFPTLWRLATEYFFLRWLAPRSRLVNAFYGGGFAHDSVRDVEFLVGAVLLVRRQAFEDIGGFDPSFFMFNEEVDLCYRLQDRGWRVLFFPVPSSSTWAELRLGSTGTGCTANSFAHTSASSGSTTDRTRRIEGVDCSSGRCAFEPSSSTVSGGDCRGRRPRGLPKATQRPCSNRPRNSSRLRATFDRPLEVRTAGLRASLEDTGRNPRRDSRQQRSEPHLETHAVRPCHTQRPTTGIRTAHA